MGKLVNTLVAKAAHFKVAAPVRTGIIFYVIAT